MSLGNNLFGLILLIIDSLLFAGAFVLIFLRFRKK